MKSVVIIIVLITIIQYSSGMSFEPKIIGGTYAADHQFPYTAFMVTINPNKPGFGCCGASILNQYFLLTAAHCFDNCKGSRCNVVAIVGNARITEVSQKIYAANYKVHEHYDYFNVYNDIATARLTASLKLGMYVSRIAVLHRTLFHEVGYIAGWGRTAEDQQSSSTELKYLTQVAKTRNECLTHLSDMPPGTFCGETQHKSEGYIAVGDSGSSLVIHGFIAIGLVSYRETGFGDYIVFTDIAYHYDWIARNTKILHCRGDK